MFVYMFSRLAETQSNTIKTGIPAYIARIKPGRFPLVLRNLHWPAIFLNATMMTLVLALVPLDDVLKGANILSVLAENVGKLHPIVKVKD